MLKLTPLGDWTPCLRTHCSDGQAQIQAMVDTYNQLAPSVQQKYKVQVEGIQSSAYSLSSAVEDLVTGAAVASYACCDMRDLGTQAVEITNQMRAEMGMKPVVPLKPPEPPGFFDTLKTGAKWFVGIAVLGVATYAGVKIYRAARAPSHRHLLPSHEEDYEDA